MSENLSDDKRLQLDEALIEASILKNKVAPEVENAIKDTAESNPTVRGYVDKLGETGYLELGQQRLDQIKTQHPEFYAALTSFTDAMDRLAETLRPGYTTKIWKGHYLSPAQAKIAADSVSVEDYTQARKTAMQNASVMVSELARDIKTKPSDYPSDILQKVAGLVAKEMEDGLSLHRADLHSAQIGALIEAVLARIAMTREEKKVKPEFSLNFTSALNKQTKYDQTPSPVSNQGPRE